MSTLGCADVREVAPEFALGVLDAEARADVLLHLDHCASCQRQVGELSEMADSLVLLAPEAEPPAGFERRVLGAMDDSARRRRWRTAKLVAVTAAAAVIISVVTVRIVDQARSPATQSAAPAVETVAMVGADGQQVGRVDVVADGTLASLNLSVDYALPDGDYRIVLESPDGSRSGLGNVQVVNNRGSWSGTTRIAGPADVALLDEAGRMRCSAKLPTT